MSSLIEALGAKRVLEPHGALPQAARRLDLNLPLQRYELEVGVDTLCLDSTSFRQLVESNDRDPVKIGEAIMNIVAERGKMQNPVTGSGGILTGTVRAVGETYPDPPSIGRRIVTLASLTLTPLRLESVGDIDPGSPHVPVTGTAYLPWTAPWADYPQGVPLDAALAALDVCNSASQTRALIDGDTRIVLVLGGGHAGLLALAAARDKLSDPEARLVLMDADERICQRARDLDLCDVALRADLRDAVGALQMLEHAGIPRADLTVVVVNATDCEAASILLTADHGTVLFFSMGTSFTKAALGSEGMASTARMLIGSGYMPDRGAYALELLSRDERLRHALGAVKAPA
ncbi:MAG: L-erythro-3,5-diaminohexanoate dehydrogenase [Actinomycetota bacterium]|nr:L-erythro-3,5-diaminohexanoate dehydrogenase [Actinomycetota bacterium]